MLYYDTRERKSKMIGAAAAVAYIILWVVLMFVVNFTFAEQETGEGILIDFGDTEMASGQNDPDDTDSAGQNTQQPAAPDTDPQDMLTQDFEDAPEIPQQQNNTPQTRQQPDNDRNQQPESAQQPAREVDQRALFPGRTSGSQSASEGPSDSGQGNQGAQEGAPQGDHQGTGVGGGGTSFDLTGRSVSGQLPYPSYDARNKEGRVIVTITVDPRGNVVNAIYRPAGSTTNDSELVNAALRAARQSRFNAIEADNLQTGTITYNFRLR